jgi:transposase
MEVMFDRVAGLDVGKGSVTVCVRTPGSRGRRSETRTFKTTTGSLHLMRGWLVEAGVSIAAMESTSTYWKPAFYCLEEVMEVWLLNAAHMKAVPGRKSDVRDAEWIAQLLEHGLLRPSFVPPPEIRRLRMLTRYRVQLMGDRSREIVRLELMLELSRSGARCSDYSGSVSPDRSPNPPCASRRNGLSTEPAVLWEAAPTGSGCSLGSGIG